MHPDQRRVRGCEFLEAAAGDRRLAWRAVRPSAVPLHPPWRRARECGNHLKQAIDHHALEPLAQQCPGPEQPDGALPRCVSESETPLQHGRAARAMRQFQPQVAQPLRAHRFPQCDARQPDRPRPLNWYVAPVRHDRPPAQPEVQTVRRERPSSARALQSVLQAQSLRPPEGAAWLAAE